MADTALISRNEAAELSGASSSAVNKAIEAKVIRTVKEHKRALVRTQDVSVLALFSYLQAVGLSLTAAQRRRLATWARSDELELALSDVVLVRRPDEVIRAQENAQRYVKQRSRFLEINPKVQGGEPVIKGTRVPIRGLAKQIEQGESLKVLKREYDYIEPEAFEFAVRWANANPRRGRPQARPAGKGREPNARREHLSSRRSEESAGAA